MCARYSWIFTIVRCFYWWCVSSRAGSSWSKHELTNFYQVTSPRTPGWEGEKKSHLNQKIFGDEHKLKEADEPLKEKLSKSQKGCIERNNKHTQTAKKDTNESITRSLANQQSSTALLDALQAEYMSQLLLVMIYHNVSVYLQESDDYDSTQHEDFAQKII